MAILKIDLRNGMDAPEKSMIEAGCFTPSKPVLQPAGEHIIRNIVDVSGQ